MISTASRTRSDTCSSWIRSRPNRACDACAGSSGGTMYTAGPATFSRRSNRRRSATARALQLSLRHPRATFDSPLPRIVVELRLGPTAATPVRSQTAPAAGGDVVGRGSARCLRFAGTGALLVDGSRGDLLGLLGTLAAFDQALLDVLGLAV